MAFVSPNALNSLPITSSQFTPSEHIARQPLGGLSSSFSPRTAGHELSLRSNTQLNLHPLLPDVGSEAPFHGAVAGLVLNLMLWGGLTTRMMQISDKADEKVNNSLVKLALEIAVAGVMITGFKEVSASVDQVNKMTDPFNRYVEVSNQLARQHQGAEEETAIKPASPLGDQALMHALRENQEPLN